MFRCDTLLFLFWDMRYSEYNDLDNLIFSEDCFYHIMPRKSFVVAEALCDSSIGVNRQLVPLVEPESRIILRISLSTKFSSSNSSGFDNNENGLAFPLVVFIFVNSFGE